MNQSKKFKILVAHPGQQHSFRVAESLKKQNCLSAFFTCVYDLPNSIPMKLAHAIVRGNDTKKMAKRKSIILENEDIHLFYTFLSLCVIVLSRSKYTHKLSIWLDRRIADLFGLKVAKYAIKNNVDAVICFSNNERTCFKKLKEKAPNILRIMDCANSPVNYMKHIYDKDISLDSTSLLKLEVPDFWNANNLKKQFEGIELTDMFLAPSNFVRDGLKFCGVDNNRIKVLHYGSNFVPIDIKTKNINNSEELQFLYVGQVSYRKGVHHLCRSFLKTKKGHLNIVGSYNFDTDLYEKYKDEERISFYGHVNHDKVKEIMEAADVFVFASLTEGFSLSCLEAMSCGLPIICSSNAGANDLVVDGFNGYIFDPFDENRLTELIDEFDLLRNDIPQMSNNAIETAKKCTWDDYSINLYKILQENIS